jgi:homocysteine S-methyltransferase
MREPIILLDGAMATELAARGFSLDAPLFSAQALLDAPELVEQIHFEYLVAGAQILTSNSFGLHASSLAKAGIGEQQGALLHRALEILTNVRHRARERDPSLARFRVAGSIPPRPREVWALEPALGRAEYRNHAKLLADAGADLILLETFTTLAEISLALEGVSSAGLELPIWLAVAAGAPQVGGGRPDGARLIGGEALTGLAPLLERVDALLINCTQIDAVPGAIAGLLAAAQARPNLPLGLYPHLGRRQQDGVWIERIVDPEVFAEQIHAWVRARPQFSLVGACCGSQPSYTAALRRALQHDEAATELAWTRLAQLIP